MAKNSSPFLVRQPKHVTWTFATKEKQTLKGHGESQVLQKRYDEILPGFAIGVCLKLRFLIRTSKNVLLSFRSVNLGGNRSTLMKVQYRILQSDFDPFRVYIEESIG